MNLYRRTMRATHYSTLLGAAQLIFTLALLSGCDREPGIVVNITAWPDGVDSIRVRTKIAGAAGTNILLAKDQTRFAVRLPVGSQGMVQLDADGLDGLGCKLAAGSLTEPVPDNLSRWVERQLELSPVECIFATPIPFKVGQKPSSVVVGDFTGDINPDLAVANSNDNTVSVLRGDGAGGFSPAANFPAGAAPQSVAVGDFDGDMKLDLVVPNFITDGTVSVLLNNGLGGFSAPTSFPVGKIPSFVAVGNFIGDKELDLVVANLKEASVSLLPGNGMGSFGPGTKFPVGGGPFSVSVGDFNGDTKPDLAVANASSDNVSVLLGDDIVGFKPTIDFAVGKIPYVVAVGDFDGDTKPDLAVANYSDNKVSVLIGGSFPFPSNVCVGNGPISVAVGDFNRDKNLDLVVTNSLDNTVSVLLGLGDGKGGFRPAIDFPVGTNPYSVAVGDFNKDGKPDLAVANYNDGTVSILLNRSR